MDVASLSDNDLRKELIARGVNCGPVNSTSRSMYEKKLIKKISEDAPIEVENGVVNASGDAGVVEEVAEEALKKTPKRGVKVLDLVADPADENLPVEEKVVVMQPTQTPTPKANRGRRTAPVIDKELVVEKNVFEESGDEAALEDDEDYGEATARTLSPQERKAARRSGSPVQEQGSLLWKTLIVIVIAGLIGLFLFALTDNAAQLFEKMAKEAQKKLEQAKKFEL